MPPQGKKKVEVLQENESEVAFQGKLQINLKRCIFDTLKIKYPSKVSIYKSVSALIFLKEK